MRKNRVRRHEVVQPQDQSIKLIPLTKGQNAIVDVADYDWLMQWNWTAKFHERFNRYYAFRRDEDWNAVYMHREISRNMNQPHTDHWNGNGLDNRRENLRPCNNSQNGANRGKQRNNTSGYKGVFANNGGRQWMAKIEVKLQSRYLGSFSTKEAAARAYDIAAKEAFGEFAVLNFPDQSHNSLKK
jgi:hypothetical protein